MQPFYLLIALVLVQLAVSAGFWWQQRRQYETHLHNSHELEFLFKRLQEWQQNNQQSQRQFEQSVQQHWQQASNQQQQAFTELREQLHEQNYQQFRRLLESLQRGIEDNKEGVTKTLTAHNDRLQKQVEHLNETVAKHLRNISDDVDKRLAAGFEKTTQTFTDVIKRLAMIDAAQKKITELSTDLVSLQEILNDKRSRGAFGEVQLSSLLHNVLPENAFSQQHTMSNGKTCRLHIVLTKTNWQSRHRCQISIRELPSIMRQPS